MKLHTLITQFQHHIFRLIDVIICSDFLVSIYMTEHTLHISTQSIITLVIRSHHSSRGTNCTPPGGTKSENRKVFAFFVIYIHNQQLNASRLYGALWQVTTICRIMSQFVVSKCDKGATKCDIGSLFTQSLWRNYSKRTPQSALHSSPGQCDYSKFTHFAIVYHKKQE